jgi:hypothetical protein
MDAQSEEPGRSGDKICKVAPNICWYVAILAPSIWRSDLKLSISGAIAKKINFLLRRKQPVSNTKANQLMLFGK